MPVEWNASIVLNRPQKRNALSPPLLPEFRGLLEEARDIGRPEASESQGQRLMQLKRAALESQDHGEALHAFAEKRTPVFKGR
jgi:enoyl-CoA hydratase/carnithine racemase